MNSISRRISAGLAAISLFGPAAAAGAGEVTFNRDVAPILQARCQECHRPGELAPMSLLTYAEARPWAKAIRKSVAAREMPPWDADPNYGKFRNDFSLTPEQMDTIIKWVDADAPEGKPADLPPARVWPDTSEWHAGKPDIELYPSAPFVVPVTARNEDIYQCIVLPLGFAEDMWATGFEYRPEKRQVVHHIIGFLDVKGEALKLDQQTPEPGFRCGMGGSEAGGLRSNGIDAMIGGWAPGVQPNIYTNGVGKLIPAGANIVLQMHYHNETGAEVADLSGIGVHFAKETIRAKARIMPVSSWKINIPAGEPNAEHRAQWRVPRDLDISSLMPHMHYIGKDMTISAVYPDNTSEILIHVPTFDFNWQTVYVLAQPKRIPRGTVVHMVSHHNNSADNPANPSKPPINVTWGEATTEEMAIGWIGYTYPDENLKIAPKEFKPVGAAPAAGDEKQLSANSPAQN